MNFLRFAAAFIAGLSALPASSMEIVVEEMQLGPFGESVWIRMVGDIETGDAQRLLNLVEAIEYDPMKSINFEFDSNGGSVVEAIKIGTVISALPHGVTTTVGGDGMNETGVCASACVLAFLGGHYRFANANELGVHQFFYGDDDDMNSALATSISQSLSADIVRYLSQMRVDTDFFKVMTRASPDEIYWIPEEELLRYRIANRAIYDESEEYKNAKGFFYLLLWQQSRYGENKIVVGCSEGSPILVAFLQPPAIYANDDFEIRIDGIDHKPENWEIVREGRWVEIAFVPTEEQIARIMTAKTFGARMYPPSRNFFFGFEKQVQTAKLRDTLSGCDSAARSTSVGHAPPLPSNSQDASVTEDVGIDLPGGDLLQMGIKGITFSQCKKVCRSMPDCRAVTWVEANGWCWPKHTINKPVRRSGLTSAIVRH